jgi:hypothetical protein
VAGFSTSTVQASVPSKPVCGSLAAEQGVEQRGRGGLRRGQGAELLAAPAHQRGHGGHHAGEAARLAVGREGQVEGVLVGQGGQLLELELQPAAVGGAQVHRQGLGQRTQRTRLLGAVDPDLEDVAAGLADEEREVARRGAQHEGPGRVAGRQRGRPGQRSEASTGAREGDSCRRWLASRRGSSVCVAATGAGVAAPAAGAGVVLSTAPSTLLGR